MEMTMKSCLPHINRFWLLALSALMTFGACEENTEESIERPEENSSENTTGENRADDEEDEVSESEVTGDEEEERSTTNDEDAISENPNDDEDDVTLLTEGECIVHGQTCACVEETAKNTRLPVDIIFAVDSSGSMQVARNKIQSGLSGLADIIEEAGIDTHIVLLAATSVGDEGAIDAIAWCVPKPLGSGECGGGTVGSATGNPLGGPGKDSNEPTFLHLNVPFGMSQAASTLLNQYPAYKHVLREKAQKQFVAVEDFWTFLTPKAFQNRLSSMDPPVNEGDWTFNAVHTNIPGNNNYTNLVKTTGGYEGWLNQAAKAFDELLKTIADNVVDTTPLACEWTIPPAPEGESFDKDKVNVRFTSSKGKVTEYKKVTSEDNCKDRQGWFYDHEKDPKKVLVCPATCEKIQKDTKGKINIIMGCATVVLIV